MTSSRTEHLTFTDPDEALEELVARFGPQSLTSLSATSFDLDLHLHIASTKIMLWSQTSGSGYALAWENRFDGFSFCPTSSGQDLIATEDGPNGRVHMGQGLLTDTRRMKSWKLMPGSFDSVSIPADELHRRLSLLLEQPIHTPLQFGLTDIKDLKGFEGMRQMCRGIAKCLDDFTPPLNVRSLTRSFEELAINFLLEAVPHNYSDLLQRRPPQLAPKQVRRAIEFMHANARRGDRLSMEAIAQAANVSIRSLQASFANSMHMSPMLYLKSIRLRGVRAELQEKHGAVSVNETASAWGFAHPGAFSKAYRDAFGELPSETVRDAKFFTVTAVK